MGKFLLISLCVVVVASSVMAEPQIIQMGEYCPRFKTGEVLANHFTESFGICTPNDSVWSAGFLVRVNFGTFRMSGSAELSWLSGIDTLPGNNTLTYYIESDSEITVQVTADNGPVWLLPSPDTIPLFEIAIELEPSGSEETGVIRFDSTNQVGPYYSDYFFYPHDIDGTYHGLGDQEIKYSDSLESLISINQAMTNPPEYCYPCEPFQIQFYATSELQNPNFSFHGGPWGVPFEIDEETDIWTFYPPSSIEYPSILLVSWVSATFCDGAFEILDDAEHDNMRIEIQYPFWVTDTCACGTPPEFVNGQPNRFVAEDVDTLAIPLQLEDYSNMPSWFSHWTSTQDPVVPGHMDSTGTFYFHPGPGDTATYWVYATLACGTQYRDTIGFYIYNWHNYTCGDVNHSYDIDISDLTWLVSYLFQNGIQPAPMKAGDLTCDDNVDVSDLTRLVNYLFLEGPPPPENCEQ